MQFNIEAEIKSIHLMPVPVIWGLSCLAAMHLSCFRMRFGLAGMAFVECRAKVTIRMDKNSPFRMCIGQYRDICLKTRPHELLPGQTGRSARRPRPAVLKNRKESR